MIRKIMLMMFLFLGVIRAELIDLLDKEAANSITYLGREYVIDRTCSELDMKKLLTVLDDLLHERPSKRFYLDMCTEFKNLYFLEKKRLSKNYNPAGMAESYKYLLSIAPKSYYVNFYSYLFQKQDKSVGRLPIRSKVLLAHPENDYTKYYLLWKDRKTNKSGMKEPYLKVAFNRGKELLNSKHDIIYINIANDIKRYLKKKELYDKYVEFLYYMIAENKKRGFNNWEYYLELANFFFEQTYLEPAKMDKELIVDLLKKSWKEKPDQKEQISLYNKIWIMNHYLDLIKTWPKYISNIEEYDMIQDEKKLIKRYSKYVSSRYYYLAAWRAFLYEHLYYIKPKSQKIPEELRKQIKIQLKFEKDLRRKIRLKEQLRALRDGTFLTAGKPKLKAPEEEAPENEDEL